MSEENIKCNIYLQDQIDNHFPTTASAAQRNSEWFNKRIGKVTGSKAPSVIGLHGRNELCRTWNCIGNKIPEAQFQKGQQV